MADIPMPNAPPTPGEDPEPKCPTIDYSPATAQYDEAFENQLMQAILYPSDKPAHLNPSDDAPHIPPTALPVPLYSHLRTHPSPVPGLLLTHPHGYHTGGPGPSPSSISDFAQKFIQENGIQDAGQLERIVEEKIREKMEIVRERMRDREEAVKKNEAVNRQLEDLEVQRSAEVKVVEMIKREKEKKSG
ncbi:uncharacterized protein BDR25DRAFT_209533 [Lindgomyces ingoldianus]|uniref:Uncharacterized protein n=1 Tax=Lindgomyces ingoldianus TaxID=673940 RepID=A0ACB6RCJ7_9PLEO|nr:uncharacterized protein BDR25DRAFT_209533 [Lindgomyces ingoldianus]KAF2476911.1 hypothetical protein BDR25DRAFT_209533 [Lindgomyces ingoldianus]